MLMGVMIMIIIHTNPLDGFDYEWLGFDDEILEPDFNLHEKSYYTIII